MIIEEDEKKEEKNEKLLFDLCECYLSLYYEFTDIPEEITDICGVNLMKIKLRKEENGETQKEMEMALLALCNIRFNFFEKELYLSEVIEVIKHHQELNNLSQLVYQST
ncbi:uncharacterized protein MONOS_10016 [Monocercomonoides exilis]|uniref:uncharacterized protein n=1 Tax=Monocercomonoides exilis TaxID=2049356 RepID=UPI0035595D0B|nr:hypothetical protein MONOS_10016 [Monocercomonoides exilis]|eukprot:MONOS_10016.1-p1 / transcript=MONOS_10016.1 / gene=MONOS_10016 / organism=Monocercomonoides_exilis_PA203 / gene_product=unspecified product / transcript_product=unspecified product / location=Mono_scaffold00437:26616-27007(-) / protein_length=109 / sequence_SO=supercontig / SO=protein_coding / is_pseudo=false